MPQEIIDQPLAKGYKREYAVFRVHKYGSEVSGKSGKLAEKLSGWTTDTAKLDFKTGLFCTYALVWRDVPSSSGSSGSSGGSGSGGSGSGSGSGTSTGSGTGSGSGASTGSTTGSSGATQVSARSTTGEQAQNARTGQTGDSFDMKRHVIIMCSAFALLLWQIYCIKRDGLLIREYREDKKKYIMHTKMMKRRQSATKMHSEK